MHTPPQHAPPPRLGDLLLEANLIDEIQLRVALKEQESTGERLGSALVHLGFIDEGVLAAFLSKQADLPYMNIHDIFVPPDILKLIPRQIALTHAVIPIRRTNDTLYLAMADPYDYVALEEASRATHLRISPLIAPEFRLKKTLERLYGEPVDTYEPTYRISQELSNLAAEMNDESIEALRARLDALTQKVDALTDAVQQLLRKN
ncbi:MAG: hypothetical protein GX146_08745 [Myxococcales bacterium]|jgi:type IV pilus assembly protein PilB|nr:hypothetical protein [Myxococcales bacterium]